MTNFGTNPAANVTVRDVLPAGTTFVSAEDSAPAAPGCVHLQPRRRRRQLHRRHAPAGGGAAAAIAIAVTAPNITVVLTNQAFIDPDNTIPEGDELNNTDTADTTVASVINLKITRTGPTRRRRARSPTTRSRSRTRSRQAADRARPPSASRCTTRCRSALIPLAVNAGAGNNWACQISENPINVVDCLGDLNPDQEVTITITVFITAENNRSLDNEACVDPDDTDRGVRPARRRDNCSTHTTPLGPTAEEVAGPAGHQDGRARPPRHAGSGPDLHDHGRERRDGDAVSPLTLTDDLPGQTCVRQRDRHQRLDLRRGPSGILTCDDAAGAASPSGARPQITIVVNVDDDGHLPIANTAVAAPALADPHRATPSRERGQPRQQRSTVVASDRRARVRPRDHGHRGQPGPGDRGPAVVHRRRPSTAAPMTANNVHVSIDLPASGP